MTEGTGFDSQQLKEIFLFPKKFSPHLNTHPALLSASGGKVAGA